MKLLLVFCAAILCAAYAQDVFDTFETFGSAVATEGEPMVTTTQTGAGILGGERILTARRQMGSSAALRASCSILDGFMALSADVSVQGSCTARYAGPGNTGFNPVINFNRYGCDCWNFNVRESDNNVALRVTATSASAGDLVSALTLPIDIRSPRDVCIPFAGSIENYRDISAITFDIIGNVANVDVNVDHVCCLPSVSCYHSVEAIEGADIDNLSPGDAVKLTLNCRNYPSSADAQPGPPERIRASFPFDSSIGTMRAGSIMCMGDANANGQTIANNALEFNSELLDGETVTCMVNVDLTAGGSVDDIQATVFTDRTDPGFGIPSHNGGDRSGGIEFCAPPEPSSLIIQNAPTTPPTAPPTTVPPTAPPTTLPPTAPLNVCISPRIIDGACNCQTFPCFRRADGSIRCETDEWYCWFITRVTTGEFHVSFRGQMCTCGL